MSNIPKRRIYMSAQRIPYINYVPNDGRVVILSGYYDCEMQQFYTYMLIPDGTIVAIPALDMLEGTYIARAPANERLDCRLPLLETTINYFSFGDMLSVLRDAEQDLINGLASLHKYFVLLHHVNGHKDHSGNLLISTEVEYAFGNHRSFYDLLHKMISIIRRFYQEKAPELPDSFAKIATKDAQELVEKYALPEPLIDFYKNRENVFLQLRDIRDNIFHHGHSPDSSFTFPDGFAVRVEDRLAKRLANLNLWPEDLLRENRLGSILAILAFLVNDMFDAMDGLQASLLAYVAVLPPPTISGNKVFLRSAVSSHLASLGVYRQKHWFYPKEILNISE